MSKLTPYLVFSGNCSQAMHYYASIFDGEITPMMTFGDSIMEVPKAPCDRIFNSELKANGIVIKASDDLPGHEVISGTNFSLFIEFSDEKSKEIAFEKLPDEGKKLFPLSENFGMLKDKYGMQWMLVHAS